MFRSKRTAVPLSASLVALFVAALTACGPPPGPTGKVVDKHRTYVSKQWKYKLTTRDKAGVEHEFKVKRDDYNDCYRGSKYPKCTKR